MLKKGFFTFLLILLIFTPNIVLCYEKNVSIEAENADIVFVLKSIAEQADVNIVISKSVTGTVSLKLKQVPLSKALDSILKSNNYLYSQDDKIINVYSFDEVKQQERFSEVTTRVYTLKHADVADLQRALLSMKSPRGRIEINEKANQIIVSDMRKKIEEIEIAIQRLDQIEIIKKYRLLFANAANIKTKLMQVIPEEKGEIFVDERTNSIVVKATDVILRNVDELISGWDVQSKQVLIEAKILQVTLDHNMKTGFDWQYLEGSYDLKGSFSQSLTTGGILQVGTLTRDKFKTVIEALENNTDTDILSAPKVAVMDGKEASILVGSSEPYLVQSKDTDTGLIVTETQFLDVGIKLRVTPTITEDGFVIMDIHPEVSSARRVAEVDNALAVDTTQADTTMMVKDGDTIMLGGLIKDHNTKTVNKVPFIGDIPLLGFFFRNDSTEKVKQEIVVFITPYIIHAEKEHEALKEEARRIEQLTERSMMIEDQTNVLYHEQE